LHNTLIKEQKGLINFDFSRRTLHGIEIFHMFRNNLIVNQGRSMCKFFLFIKKSKKAKKKFR